jgi:hypothetical protein
MLPDSPRWLIAHDRREEGANVLAILEDKDSPDHPDIKLKVKEIEVSLAQESAGGTLKFVLTATRSASEHIIIQVHSDIESC